MAQQAEKQRTPRDESVQRDRAYVLRLLERGTSDAKIERSLTLTTQFRSFNPGGDVLAYVRGVIADEKTSLKHPNRSQSSTVSSEAVAAASPQASSVPLSASVSAPSNSPEVTSAAVAQDNSQNETQNNSQNSASGGLAVVASGGAPLPGGSVKSSGDVASAQSNSASSLNPQPAPVAASAANVAASTNSDNFNSDQGPGPGPIGPGPGCNLFPAPASIGTTVPLSYFGPPPSDTNQSLVGPVQLLKTGQVDAANGTITIRLYLGHLKGSGKKVWYILTDVDDPNVAAELGLNFSAKLTFASESARTGNLDANGNIIFDAGKVDFKPERKVIPGPPGHEFPPTFATPGSVGDANYGPLVRIANAADVIYNAPMVAFDVDANEINFPNGHVDYSKVHDQVVAIDPFNMTVTLNLINGFSFGRPVWYLSMDTSSTLGAAIEHNTYAPLMQHLLLGTDDSFAQWSASLSVPMDPSLAVVPTHCGKVCPQTSPMAIGRTTS